jgi:hypothetical protein
MASENKTQPTAASVDEFLNGLTKAGQREDSMVLDQMMRRVTGYAPALWGKIVGYGRFDYHYPTGRQGTWFGLGFAPRAAELSIHLSLGGGEEPHGFRASGSTKWERDVCTSNDCLMLT